MITDYASQIDVTYGVIPALDLEKFYAEFPWGKLGLDSEQKQLVIFTTHYLDLVEVGKKIVSDTITKRVVKLNPQAVQAYVYFYRAFKRSGLSERYSDEEFIAKARKIVYQLEQLGDEQPSLEMKPDIDEIHHFFDFLTTQTGVLTW